MSNDAAGGTSNATGGTAGGTSNATGGTAGGTAGGAAKSDTGLLSAAPASEADAAKAAADAKTASDAAAAKAAADAASKTPEQKAADEAAAKAKGDAKWYDAEKVELPVPDAIKSLGFEQLDPDTLKAFLPVAKELDLKPETANKLVEIAGGLVGRVLAAQKTAMEERAMKWADEVKADKEFGGDKLTATVVGARDVVIKYGGPEMLKELADIGYQNSPRLIKFLARVARATADDNFDVRRGDGAASDADPDAARAARLYPGLNKGLGKD